MSSYRVHGEIQGISFDVETDTLPELKEAMDFLWPLPKEEPEPEPVFQDKTGIGFDCKSALMYCPPNGDPILLLPRETEFDVSTKRWEVRASSYAGLPYTITGTMFERHPWVYKLAADTDEVIRSMQ